MKNLVKERFSLAKTNMKNLVKERFSLAKTKVSSIGQKVTVGLAMAATMFGIPVNVYADDFSAAETGSGSEIVKNMADTVGNILTWGGVLVLIASSVAFLLAFRNEDVEGKHKAGLAFAIGIAMVGFTGILNGLGIVG